MKKNRKSIYLIMKGFIRKFFPASSSVDNHVQVDAHNTLVIEELFEVKYVTRKG
jgi:hypothetical protein